MEKRRIEIFGFLNDINVGKLGRPQEFGGPQNLEGFFGAVTVPEVDAGGIGIDLLIFHGGGAAPLGVAQNCLNISGIGGSADDDDSWDSRLQSVPR